MTGSRRRARCPPPPHPPVLTASRSLQIVQGRRSRGRVCRGGGTETECVGQGDQEQGLQGAGRGGGGQKARALPGLGAEAAAKDQGKRSLYVTAEGDRSPISTS